MLGLEVQVNYDTWETLKHKLSEWVRGDEPHTLVSLNPEGVLLARKVGGYREALSHASCVLVDGFGIQLACRLLRIPVPPRITGVDFLLHCCDYASSHHWRVFLMGGKGETAKRAAEKLQVMFPGLAVEGEEGIQYGKFKIQNSKFKINSNNQVANEGTALIHRINEFRPQALFVALGQPRQEVWIDAHIKEMPSVRVAMGVGGAFDVISGDLSRAPCFMRKTGLEWLWRLIIEPKRLPRIFNATVRFMWVIMKEK